MSAHLDRAGILGQPPSDREIEVLRLAAQGQPSTAIGTHLHLSEDTIKTHLRRLYAKLGAHDRAHAVAIGYQRGLIELPRAKGCCGHCHTAREALALRRPHRHQMPPATPYALLYDRMTEILEAQ